MRELITIALEVTGLLLIAAALGLAAAWIWPPLGVLTAGGALLGASWLLSREPKPGRESS